MFCGANGFSVLQNGTTSIKSSMRGRHPLAYPIKIGSIRHREGIFVLYNYLAYKTFIPQVQKFLSTTTSATEYNILRHVTVKDETPDESHNPDFQQAARQMHSMYV